MGWGTHDEVLERGARVREALVQGLEDGFCLTQCLALGIC